MKVARLVILMIPMASAISDGLRGGPTKAEDQNEVNEELNSEVVTDNKHRALAPLKWILPGTSPGGTDGGFWPSSFNGYPGLTEFLLQFTGGPHAVRRIKVRPTDTQAQVAFNDKNSDDDYYWKIGATNLPQGADMTIYKIASGSNARGCYTSNSLTSAENYLPVLRGFDLEFNQSTGTNRPLNQVKVNVFKNGPNTGITVCFNDDNNDDKFRWTVWYALVHESKTRSGQTYATGTRYDSGGQDSVPGSAPSGYRQVLSGFDLRFKGADARHIDRIGVDLGNDIVVHFDDNANDDDYEWDVWYTHVRN